MFYSKREGELSGGSVVRGIVRGNCPGANVRSARSIEFKLYFIYIYYIYKYIYIYDIYHIFFIIYYLVYTYIYMYACMMGIGNKTGGMLAGIWA